MSSTWSEDDPTDFTPKMNGRQTLHPDVIAFANQVSSPKKFGLQAQEQVSLSGKTSSSTKAYVPSQQATPGQRLPTSTNHSAPSLPPSRKYSTSSGLRALELKVNGRPQLGGPLYSSDPTPQPKFFPAFSSRPVRITAGASISHSKLLSERNASSSSHPPPIKPSPKPKSKPRANRQRPKPLPQATKTTPLGSSSRKKKRVEGATADDAIAIGSSSEGEGDDDVGNEGESPRVGLLAAVTGAAVRNRTKVGAATRSQYFCIRAIVQGAVFDGNSSLVFDSERKVITLKLADGESMPGKMKSHAPVDIPCNDLMHIEFCDGGEQFGHFIALVPLPTAEISGLSNLVEDLGDSSSTSPIYLFMRQDTFEVFCVTVRSYEELSHLMLYEGIIQPPTQCAAHINVFPAMRTSPLKRQARTPESETRKSRRQSKAKFSDDYIHGDEDFEDFVSQSGKRRKSEFHDLELSKADQVTMLRYPIEEDAQDVITIIKGDVRRLEPGEYLNDNLIDLSLKHMIADDQSSNRVHVFSCMFYSKMLEAEQIRRPAVERYDEAYRLVSKWTRGVDIFEKDFVFVPINENLHWSLTVIVRPGADPESEHDRPCILFLDSLNLHNATKIYNYLINYLRRAWKAQRHSDRIFDKSTIPLLKPKVPRQSNSYDCGVYTIKYAEMIFHNMENMHSTTEAIHSHFSDLIQNKAFSQKDIDNKRHEICELLENLQTRWVVARANREEREAESKSTGASEAESKAESPPVDDEKRTSEDTPTPQTQPSTPSEDEASSSRESIPMDVCNPEDSSGSDGDHDG